MLLHCLACRLEMTWLIQCTLEPTLGLLQLFLEHAQELRAWIPKQPCEHMKSSCRAKMHVQS